MSNVELLAEHLKTSDDVESVNIGYPVDPPDGPPHIMVHMADGTVMFLTVQEF